MFRDRRHFSKSFDRHERKLIGLYEEVSVWSFLGFGIIMMIDFFHLLGKQHSFVIVLNSWHMVPTAHSGSSISIFGFSRLYLLLYDFAWSKYNWFGNRKVVFSLRSYITHVCCWIWLEHIFKVGSECVGSVFVASGPAACRGPYWRNRYCWRAHC